MTETNIHNERAPSAGHNWEGSNDCAEQGLQGKLNKHPQQKISSAWFLHHRR